MLWWQPILVAFPELSIHNDWGEFVDQLNTYFRQPDLAQASKCALGALKMQDYQHVNKYMIKFSKHATHTGWNNAALYGEFYRGLVSRTGFLTQLKSKKVEIGEEKMSQMIIKEKLSERAVVKENGLGRVCLQERRITPK